MKKNIIISIALVTAKGAQLLLIGSFLVTLVLLVHWHLDKGFYEHFYLTNGFEAGLDSYKLRISNTAEPGISIGALGNQTMYWLFFRYSLILLLTVMIIRRCIVIIRSIGSLGSFYSDNVKAFRSIFMMGLTLSCIAVFNFGTVGNSTEIHFTIPFTPLLFSLVSLVLGEVFKEGKKLLDDSTSII